VRDLLTFRMGFGLIMAPPDTHPIQRAVSEQQIMTLGPWPSPLSPDEWLRRFATLPLMHQPGEKWMYNTAYWVLALLITRASGQAGGDLDAIHDPAQGRQDHAPRRDQKTARRVDFVEPRSTCR
jgi:CubicO group peptidase (beta-lactamase class C family)